MIVEGSSGSLFSDGTTTTSAILDQPAGLARTRSELACWSRSRARG